MTLLIAGVILWSLVHFIPSLGIALKQSLITRFGENTYKGLFSIIVLTSLVFMVLGWKQSEPQLLYMFPVMVTPISLVLMIVAFILFGAAKHPTRIKRFIRHPQLMSVVVWSIGHLLVNGDSRSLVLFGGLGLWAILDMILINQREGEWIKAPAPTWVQEVKGLAISMVMLVVIVLLHPYIAGVPVNG